MFSRRRHSPQGKLACYEERLATSFAVSECFSTTKTIFHAIKSTNSGALKAPPGGCYGQ